MTVQMKCLFVLSLVATTFAADLIMNGGSQTLGGYQVYGIVRLTNSAKLIVPDYNEVDAVNTGHLQLNATSIYIDATSSISARGAGYKTKGCMNGTAPAQFPGIGAAGGCAVKDSGGGGGHVGPGGIGTKDCALRNDPPKCLEPQEYEEACDNTMVAGANTCPNYVDCRNNDALPRTAGDRYLHSVFDRELGMGPSGGDKGCRDGDGFGVPTTGGAGGGRIRLMASGTMEVYGKVDASGKRGCGTQNDSGGGGAGGTVVLVADTLILGLGARIKAAGGLGGDSQGKNLGDFPECTGTQLSGQCDDCGGGGGGGIIYVKARAGNFSNVAAGKVVDTTIFDIKGAEGGACTGCKVESRGIDGRVQLGSFGELCNGFDDTWDGIIDEDQADMDCAGTLYKSCINGVPQDCPDLPTIDDPTTQDSTSTPDSTASAPDTQSQSSQSPSGSQGSQGSNSQGSATKGSSSNSQGSRSNSQGTQGTNQGSRSNSQGSQGSATAGSQTDKSNGISVSGTQNSGSGNSGSANTGTSGTGQGPISESSGAVVMVSVLSLIAVLMM